MSGTIFNKHQGLRRNRRQQALTMFLDGKTLDDVILAIGLKRSTASCYLYEARQIAEHEPHRVTAKRDPMLD